MDGFGRWALKEPLDAPRTKKLKNRRYLIMKSVAFRPLGILVVLGGSPNRALRIA